MENDLRKIHDSFAVQFGQPTLAEKRAKELMEMSYGDFCKKAEREPSPDMLIVWIAAVSAAKRRFKNWQE